jgi:hypothetical protein
VRQLQQQESLSWSEVGPYRAEGWEKRKDKHLSFLKDAYREVPLAAAVELGMRTSRGDLWAVDRITMASQTVGWLGVARLVESGWAPFLRRPPSPGARTASTSFLGGDHAVSHE